MATPSPPEGYAQEGDPGGAQREPPPFFDPRGETERDPPTAGDADKDGATAGPGGKAHDPPLPGLDPPVGVGEHMEEATSFRTIPEIDLEAVPRRRRGDPDPRRRPRGDGGAGDGGDIRPRESGGKGKIGEPKEPETVREGLDGAGERLDLRGDGLAGEDGLDPQDRETLRDLPRVEILRGGDPDPPPPRTRVGARDRALDLEDGSREGGGLDEEALRPRNPEDLR